MSSRNNPNRIKIHRSYTVIDVSETLGVHPKTVRNWIRAGLPVFDEKRPLLIRGIDLEIYLKQKRKTYMLNVKYMKCIASNVNILKTQASNHYSL